MYNSYSTSYKNQKPIGRIGAQNQQQKKPGFSNQGLRDEKLHQLDDEQKEFHLYMMRKYRDL